MANNYILIIGDCFPGAEAILPGGADPFDYSALVWTTTPIDQATLDASECATNPEDIRNTGIQDIRLGDLTDADTSTTVPAAGDKLEFDGTNWVPVKGGSGGSGLDSYDDVLEFGFSGKIKNKFLESAYSFHTSLDSTALALANGRIVHVTISTEKDVITNFFVQVITNAVPTGSGVFMDGTQIGADLEKPVGVIDKVFTNLTGYEFSAEDRIQIYIKEGAGGAEAFEPVIRMFVQYD